MCQHVPRVRLDDVVPDFAGVGFSHLRMKFWERRALSFDAVGRSWSGWLSGVKVFGLCASRVSVRSHEVGLIEAMLAATFQDDGRRAAIGQTLEGSFSALSKPNFASKYAFESSRRDLHNALLCTALEAHSSKIC